MRFINAAVTVLLLIGACGSVSTDQVDNVDAARSADAPLVDGPLVDAAWTHNAVWLATDGLPSEGCAPWSLITTSAPEVPVLADGTLTLSNDVHGEGLSYRQEADVLLPVTTLVFEARARYVSGATSRATRTHVIMYATMGGKHMVFAIGDGEVFYLSAGDQRGATATVATSDAFHDYRLELHVPSGGIAAYHDGVRVLTGTAYDVSDPDTINFGDTTGYSYGTSEWRRVTHNAHKLGPCP